MKKIEQFLAALAIVGLVMRLIPMSGGAEIIGISLSLLALLYYPLGFFYFNSIKLSKVFKSESYKGITFFRGFGSFLAGLLFSIIAIGSIFKLLLLPGANEMLLIGFWSTSLFLMVILFQLTRSKSTLLIVLVKRTAIWAVVGGILWLTPGLTLAKIYYRDNPENLEYFENQIQEREAIEEPV